MKNLDIEWLQRIRKSHDKLDRTILPNSKIRRCTQEILISRYFKFLKNKCFKLYIKKEVYYMMFLKSIHTVNNGYVYSSYGINKYLSYSPYEFEITFIDEKVKNQGIIVSWNDLLEIKYEKISKKKYYRMVKKFII